MKIEEYYDGLAFYTEDGEYEIAFYSKITDRVRYSEKNGYKYWKSAGYTEIPYDDNCKIMEEIKRYKKSLECGI